MKTLTFHVNYDNQIYTYKAGTEVMILITAYTTKQTANIV